MTNFVQFAHGLLVDVENFARQHSEPLPSFNPHPDDLQPPSAEPLNAAPAAPVADVPAASPPPVQDVAVTEHTAPAEGETVAHTPATDASVTPPVASVVTPKAE